MCIQNIHHHFQKASFCIKKCHESKLFIVYLQIASCISKMVIMNLGKYSWCILKKCSLFISKPFILHLAIVHCVLKNVLVYFQDIHIAFNWIFKKKIYNVWKTYLLCISKLIIVYLKKCSHIIGKTCYHNFKILLWL